MTGASFRASAATLALLTVLLGGFFSRPLPAQTAGVIPTAAASLRGQIFDPDGLPIANASVVLRALNSGSLKHRKSDAAGGYGFSGIGAGRYWLSASHPGLADQTRMIEVKGWDSLDAVNLQLSLSSIVQDVMVVTGSRTEELSNESPVKVETLGRERIRETGYQRLSDILAEIPGVVTQRGSSGADAGEQIRGIDSRQVAVLTDGYPVIGARGIKSGVLNLNRQSVGRLDRVEVVKGASSALYGNEAIGGVINMITRDPIDPFEANVNISGGSLGALDARADFGGRLDKVAYFLEIGRHQQKSYTLIPNSQSTAGPATGRNDVLLKARYNVNSQLGLGLFASAYRNRQLGRSLGATGVSRSAAHDSNQSYGLNADITLTGSTSLQLRAYSARYDENSRIAVLSSSPSAPAVANLNERYKRLDATLSRTLGSHQFFQAGAEWARDTYKGANRLVGDNKGQRVRTFDIWLQDRIQLGRAILFLGGRRQSHSTFGGYFAPKAGLSVRAAGGLVLRASYGHGFRAPDLGQLFYRFANPTSSYQVIGNPGLQPETSRSYSAGLVYSSDRFKVGFDLFRNDVKDLIESLNVGTPRANAELQDILKTYGIPPIFDPLLNRRLFVYQNLSRIYTQGFELNGEAALPLNMRVQAGYTYLDARDKLSGSRMTQRYRHQGSVRTEYMNRRLDVSANLRGTFFSHSLLASGSRTSSYAIWDIYGSKRLARSTTLYASIDNVFDSTDPKLLMPVPSFDRADYGRTFRAGLRYSFVRERN